MAIFFRICQRRWAATAMDGEGARMHGGRWNPPGLAVVYLADSRALAALEILVHASRDAIGLEWAVLEVEVPDELIGTVGTEDLPDGWDGQPSSAVARAIGGKWIAEGRLLTLRLPSAVIPEENAVILNPRHTEISRVKVSAPRDFPFDKRLTG